MLGDIINFVKRLFGVKPQKTQDEQSQQEEERRQYEQARQINFDAIFAQKLSKKAMTESKITVETDNARSVLIDKTLQEIWGKMTADLCAYAIGTGGFFIVPYVSGGKIKYDVVSQDRVIINTAEGNTITACTIIADFFACDYKRYTRLTDYTLINGVCTITNRAVRDGAQIPLDSVPQWQGIPEVIGITGCKALPLSYFKGAKSKRKTGDIYGTNICYGCNDTIRDINETLCEVRKEYLNKQSRLGIDERMIITGTDGKSRRVPDNYIKLHTDSNSFFEIFDPAIRDTRYYNRLDKLFALLEVQVGTSRGILTEQTTAYATATEIKQANFDTFTMVDGIRTNIVNGVNQLVEALQVLANYYNLSPAGEVLYKITWDYQQTESSTETWAQIRDGVAMHVVSPVEARQYIYPSESREQAEKAIEGIPKEKAKDILDTIGGVV